MTGRRAMMVLAVMTALSLGWATWATRAQTAPRAVAAAPPTGAADATRFEFLVVESFDARYLGDTPAHLGRGATGRNAPRVALGDLIYRGATKVGTVTALVWNEARESLEVEFSPEPFVRISIGDPVWVAIPATGKTP